MAVTKRLGEVSLKVDEVFRASMSNVDPLHKPAIMKGDGQDFGDTEIA